MRFSSDDWASRYESLLDRQIRAAQERGEFDDLPGAGKPLPSDSVPYRPDWWLNQVVEREGVGAYAIPPELALRKVADELRAGAVESRLEWDVREAVAMYNEQAERQRPNAAGGARRTAAAVGPGPDRRGLASGTFGRALIRALIRG